MRVVKSRLETEQPQGDEGWQRRGSRSSLPRGNFTTLWFLLSVLRLSLQKWEDEERRRGSRQRWLRQSHIGLSLLILASGDDGDEPHRSTGNLSVFDHFNRRFLRFRSLEIFNVVILLKFSSRGRMMEVLTNAKKDGNSTPQWNEMHVMPKKKNSIRCQGMILSLTSM